MGRLTVVRSQYTQKKDVINAVYYVMDLQKCTHCLCGSNMILGEDFILSPE